MTDAMAAPYSSDTRAKGWRFELDHERIRQSDTWALASPEVRPWLLMLWMVAWEQVPCGSLPSEDALIAARIGMPPKAFAKHRDVLLRGWWQAEDGRLYHDTLCERVLEMVGYREKSAKRVADYKARMREQHAGNALPERETPVKNDTGTGTGTLKEEPPKPPRGSVHEFPPGFESLWSEYPRKVGKDAAARAFAKRKPDSALLAAMVAAVKAQRDTEQWRKDGGQFIPHLSTWLNEGRWKDEQKPAVDSELAELFARGNL